jgi:hypothetical protein
VHRWEEVEAIVRAVSIQLMASRWAAKTENGSVEEIATIGSRVEVVPKHSSRVALLSACRKFARHALCT